MHFGGAPLGLLAGTAFTLLLASACAFDLRVRRIPNRLVATLELVAGSASPRRRLIADLESTA